MKKTFQVRITSLLLIAALIMSLLSLAVIVQNTETVQDEVTEIISCVVTDVGTIQIKTEKHFKMSVNNVQTANYNAPVYYKHDRSRCENINNNAKNFSEFMMLLI